MPSFRQDRKPLVRPLRRPKLDLSVVRAQAKAAWDKGEELAAAGDLAGGLNWLGRAHRIAPSDQNLCFALACMRLHVGDAAGAASIFGELARRHDVRECWTGLALASLRTGDVAEAVSAAQAGLASHAVDDGMISVARQIVQVAGLAGWCGVRHDGTLLAEAGDATISVRLDDQPLHLAAHDRLTRKLPEIWRRARRLTVAADDVPLLGSDLAVDAIACMEGYVARTPDGIAGWAWHPAAPERCPNLRAVMPETPTEPEVAHIFSASDPTPEVDGNVPLARPRGFALAVPTDREVHVLGADGRHILGSPLMPERLSSAAGPATVAWPKRRPEPDLPTDVVIPVYRGLQTTLDCLASVMATVKAPNRIVVVDDASPEPTLVSALNGLAASGAILLVRPADGQRSRKGGGFPAAANAGIRASASHHVVLLNSDTLVAPGWLQALRAAACSAADIGTATPLSNEATIFSYPDPAGNNPAPDIAGTRALAALAAEVNALRLVDVPTAHGFCMFIRRDCLEVTGLLDEASFAQGYGEENDFCERATSLGFRHVAVPGVFVAHVGNVSFGAARLDLLRRNLTLLHRRYPDYAGRVEAFMEADHLAPARRRLDAARWRANARQQEPGHAPSASVLLVTHGGGGGTTRIVGERAQAVRAQGLRPIVLRAVDGLCEVGDAEGAYPNLVFALPAELGPLARLLKADNPVAAELHHLLGHDHSVLGLFAALHVPYDVWVHDYGWFCARLSFVTGEGKFCGEAPAKTCEGCVSRWGAGSEHPVAPAALRARSAHDMRRARYVVVPSADVARRVARHVPGLVPQIMAWEDAPEPRPASVNALRAARRRVAIVGAIGLEKGFEVLLACAQDAADRALALEFVVVGYTVDDAALMQTGHAFVTGEFTRGEAASLIGAQQAGLAFLPSVWPETWCYALSDIWSAGLSAAVFDIGTPADRVRQSGAGWVIPLGLPAPRVNDVLLSLS